MDTTQTASTTSMSVASSNSTVVVVGNASRSSSTAYASTESDVTRSRGTPSQISPSSGGVVTRRMRRQAELEDVVAASRKGGVLAGDQGERSREEGSGGGTPVVRVDEEQPMETDKVSV